MGMLRSLALSEVLVLQELIAGSFWSIQLETKGNQDASLSFTLHISQHLPNRSPW